MDSITIIAALSTLPLIVGGLIVALAPLIEARTSERADMRRAAVGEHRL